MGKVLAWVAVALVVWATWRLVTISKRRAERARDAAGAAPGGEDADPSRGGARRPDAPELMMQCARCGVHLPGSEARFAGGRVYCSDAHRDEAASGTSAERAPNDRG
jgi:uncharacterized protein